ncbi:MAG: hypothetical protein K9N00_02385, partial [Candidatus Marinimicrobia bacterium]|nr:hypothetical protein [Candidatus Neomarinimicrobiota bacterium]
FYTTRNSNPEIDIVEINPLRQIAEIRYSWELPKNLEERQKSNPKMLNIPIKVKLTLEKDSRHLKIKIDLENKVECHRLRFMFPTGLNALSSFGEGQFDVVERPVERKNTSDWIEQPMYDYPMHHFVDLFDGEKGAAVLVSGLKEYEALDDEQGTLAITLLRSFDYRIPVASMQDYSDHKGTQCLGKQSYKLAFYPHKGNWQAGQVFREAMLYNYEPRIVQTGWGEGCLDNNSSFIEFESEQIITSALKKAEDGNGYIIRLYNPGKTEVEEKIKFNFSLSDVFLTNLEEKKVNKVTIVNDNYIKLKIPSKTIQTYRLIPKKSDQVIDNK